MKRVKEKYLEKNAINTVKYIKSRVILNLDFKIDVKVFYLKTHIDIWKACKALSVKRNKNKGITRNKMLKSSTAKIKK